MGVFIVRAAALLVVIFVRHGKSVPNSLSVIVLVLSLTIFVLMPRTATLGGDTEHGDSPRLHCRWQTKEITHVRGSATDLKKRLQNGNRRLAATPGASKFRY